MSDLHDETSRTGMTTVQTTVTRDQLTRAQARAEEWLTDHGPRDITLANEILPEQPCIRGCLRDCRCNACMEAGSPVHDPRPLAAVDGLLCRTCSNKMRRWLESVCDDTLNLNLRIPDNYGWDHGHNHAKVSGSPALIRLDVMALVDPRSQGTVQEQDSDYEENQSDLGRAIPYQVCSWAAMFAEEHNLQSDVSSMAASVALLLAQWERLVSSLWVDEFYADLAKIRQALNRAHNRRPPLPRGRCFTCNTQLWQEDGNGEDTVTCPKCERVYDHLGLVKLKLQRDRDEVKRA